MAKRVCRLTLINADRRTATPRYSNYVRGNRTRRGGSSMGQGGGPMYGVKNEGNISLLFILFWGKFESMNTKVSWFMVGNILLALGGRRGISRSMNELQI